MRDLGLTDGQFGALGSAFLWGFLLSSPFVGRLVRKAPRLVVLCISVVGWSVALAATGWFRLFAVLLAVRFLFGICQSIFTATAPPVMDDSVEQKWRARALSFFYVAIPLGTALGFIFGALAERTIGWALGFVILGMIGVVASFAVFLVPNKNKSIRLAGSWLKDLRATYSSRLFIWSALGYAAQTFALGAFAFWAPTYISRVFDTPVATGSLMFGGLVVATGIGGAMLGGWVTDRWGGTNRLHFALWISLVATLVATPFVILAFAFQSELVFYMAMAVAQIALFSTFSPMNMVFMDSVPVAARTAALGSSVFISRLLGDTISVWLVGVLSDVFNDMRPAMLIIPAALALNAVLWFKASRVAKKNSN